MPAGIRRDGPGAFVELPPADEIGVNHIPQTCLNEPNGENNDNQMSELSRHDRPPSEAYRVKYPDSRVSNLRRENDSPQVLSGPTGLLNRSQM